MLFFFWKVLDQQREVMQWGDESGVGIRERLLEKAITSFAL